jgi:hypothetical protein
MVPTDIIVRGIDNKKWTLKAPGKHVIFDVPVALKENKTLDLGFKYLDANRFAVGYTMELSANAALGSGASVSGNLSIVRFSNDTYSGYNYTYAGGAYNASVGVQQGASLSAGASFFIAVNTNETLTDFNSNPKSFQGETQNLGFSQDVKGGIGGGWNVNAFWMTGWIGVSFGISAGVGEATNALSVNKGESYSVLLNDIKPTRDRGLIDKGFNNLAPVSSAVADYLKRKISQSLGAQ